MRPNSHQELYQQICRKLREIALQRDQTGPVSYYIYYPERIKRDINLTRITAYNLADAIIQSEERLPSLFDDFRPMKYSPLYCYVMLLWDEYRYRNPNVDLSPEIHAPIIIERYVNSRWLKLIQGHEFSYKIRYKFDMDNPLHDSSKGEVWINYLYD